MWIADEDKLQMTIISLFKFISVIINIIDIYLFVEIIMDNA